MASTNNATPSKGSGMEESAPLKSFMIIVPRHTFSKIFQHCTGHGVLEKYFRMGGISGKNHYCERGQVQTGKHILKESPLQNAE